MAEGYTESVLTEDDAHMMNERWEHKGERSLDFVKFHIKHFPSIGIRDNEGKLVAWELCYFFGGLGMLHVMPEHRGKRLAQYVICELAKKLISQGRNVYCFIIGENEASKRLHEKCGFYEEAGTTSVVGIVKSSKA